MSQLQGELEALKSKNTKLEVERKQLQLKTEQLQLQVAQLQAEKSLVTDANSQLVIENHSLSVSLHHSLTSLQASKFGVNLIQIDDEKTCFYTGLATFGLFLSLYEALKLYHTAALNINHFFATLLYLRLRCPMTDLGARLQKDSKSTFSRIFHSWIETMYHNLQHLVYWPDIVL